MTIDILISTFNEGIYRCKDILLPPHPNIAYKISHQITNMEYEVIPSELLNRKDVKISHIESTGLSNNRNNSLAMAEGDICLIADDDVRYNTDEIIAIIENFTNHPEIDIIVGKIKTYPGEPPYKDYKINPHKIKLYQIGSISSIEIAFRRDRIINNNIKFDNRFGIGGKLYSKGEESVFLKNCIDSSLSLWYFPMFFVKHPKESSGNNIKYDKNEAEYLGALNWKLFNKFSFITLFLFLIKHFQRYNKNISILLFIKSYIKGIKKIKAH